MHIHELARQWLTENAQERHRRAAHVRAEFLRLKKPTTRYGQALLVLTTAHEQAAAVYQAALESLAEEGVRE